MLSDNNTCTNCVIDNWTLSLVADFFEGNGYPPRIFFDSKKSDAIVRFTPYFGALSNLINSIIFYDKIFYLTTGKETAWDYNKHFVNECEELLIPQQPISEFLKLYHSNKKDDDVLFYVLTSKILGSDLIVSPFRSDSAILNRNNFTLSSITKAFTDHIDKKITTYLTDKNDPYLKDSIELNRILPSLTQLVLNESNSFSDVIKIARQISQSNYVQNYKNRINELIQSHLPTKEYNNIERKIDDILENTIYKLDFKNVEKKHILNLGFNLGIIQIDGIKISLPHIYNREDKQLILMKNIIKYRLEMHNSIQVVERLFQKTFGY